MTTQREPPSDPVPPSPDSRTVLDTAATVRSEGGARPSGAGNLPPPPVPDHELLRPIGRGSYGEVWLARNIMGTFRAVKVVYRAWFDREKPFEREFTGIQKFEPLSRSHSALVDVLQIGRTPECFYYVMELADDALTGQEIDPARYQPRTLRQEVVERGRVPIHRCVEIGLGLASGLQHLHSHGLIHRDIKPSNIIFVHGQPKLADIGLVAEQSEAKSFVGTEGFIPPEGPGTPAADVYSLGKVLYEMATGKDRHEFPELPSLTETESQAGLVELNAIILKACQNEVKLRYASAEELQQDLLLLQSGKSVKRAQVLERRFRLLLQGSVVGIVMTLLTVLAGVYFRRQAVREAQLRVRAVEGERAAQNASYASDVALAQEALRVGNLGRAQDLLSAQLPNPGERDLRGWEWRYLWQQCQGEGTLLCRRETSVVWVGALPGTSLFFVADGEGGITLWDPAARQIIRAFQTPARLTSAAVSPDGLRLAASGDFGVRVWEVGDGRLVADRTNLPNHVVSFVGGGSRLAGNSLLRNQSTWVWDLEQDGASPPGGAEMNLPNFFAHGMRIASVGGGPLVAGDWQGNLRLLDPVRGDELQRIPAHSRGVNALASSPDGRFMASSGGYGEFEIKIWDRAQEWKLAAVIPKQSDSWIGALGFSPDGSMLASGAADRTIRLWESRGWTNTHVLRGHRQEVWSLAFSSDGRRLVSGGKDGQVMMWDIPPVARTAPGPAVVRGVVDFSLAPDGSRVALVRDDGSVDLAGWHSPETVEAIAALGNDNRHCLFSEEGRLLFVTDATGQLKALDPASGHVVSTQRLAESTVRFLGNVQLGGGVVALAAGSRLILWGGASRSQVRTRELSAEPWKIDRGGRYVATTVRGASAWVGLRIWDLQTEAEQVVVDIERAHLGGIQGLEFSPGADRLVSCSGDGVIRIWEVPGGRELASLRGHAWGVNSVALSADGSRLFSSNAGSETVKVWDLSTGRDVLTLEGSPALVHRLRVSTDGTLVGGLNGDDTFFLWRAPSWEELQESSR